MAWIRELPVVATAGMNASWAISPAPTTAYRIIDVSRVLFIGCSPVTVRLTGRERDDPAG